MGIYAPDDRGLVLGLTEQYLDSRADVVIPNPESGWGVANLIGVDEVRYNTLKGVKKVAGDGSFQALDASYPIDEAYWPDWIKGEVERYHRYRS